jgi:hypothetical protein
MRPPGKPPASAINTNNATGEAVTGKNAAVIPAIMNPNRCCGAFRWRHTVVHQRYTVPSHHF